MDRLCGENNEDSISLGFLQHLSNVNMHKAVHQRTPNGQRPLTTKANIATHWLSQLCIPCRFHVLRTAVFQ